MPNGPIDPGARMVAYLLLTLAAELLIVGGLLVWLWVGA